MQLQSDLDTIKGVLNESEKGNDLHRIIIAACNLVIAAIFLFAVPVLLIVPGIVGLSDQRSETLTVGVAMLIPISILCILAAPFALAGWGLLKRKSWGNVWATVSAVVNVLNIPFGTALAIYTFWALSQGHLDSREVR